jgi:hypothetical protein
MANKQMKKHPMSLTIKEMQIKMTLRFHLIPVRMAVIKEMNRDKWCWAEGRNPSTLLVKMQISAAIMEISMEVSPETKNRTTV